MSCRQWLAASLGCLISLSGCQSHVFHQTSGNVADVSGHMADTRSDMAQKTDAASSLTIDPGFYVDKTPIDITRQPNWLNNPVVVRGSDQQSFAWYSLAVAGGAGRDVLPRYQDGLDSNQRFALNYSGTVRGALELLAAKTGYAYTLNNKDIYWQSMVSKTFDIAFMPGASDYMMGGSGSAGSSSSASSGGSGGGTSTASTTAIIDDSAASQFSNLKGTLSVWADLEAGIKQMLTPTGTVLVSQSTTSVTVRDRPANVALVGQYIDSINKSLSKQVLVKVEVLTVNLENDFGRGINWNIVQRAISNGTYQLISNNGAPIALSSAVGLTLGSTSVGLNSVNLLAHPGQTGVISLINALEQQGKVALVTQPQVLCQNNQVSAIRILDQVGYLAMVQTTSLAGSATTGGSSVTSQLTPGAVLTGLTLYVLPKIMGNKVYLQVNADISQNLGIQSIASNGANPDDLTTNSQVSIIQVPHVSQKQFNQRSIVKSGDTLILAGFRQVSNTAGASQLLGSQLLGGKRAQQINSETIVLITPIILHGLA